MTLSVDQLTILYQGPVATVCYGLFAERPVAVKVYPGRLDRRTLAGFEREQAKLRALPAEAPILRSDSVDQLTDGRHAVVMELCQQSLNALLQRVGTLPAKDVVRLGHAIARALAFAHGAGIVHGGLNPNNVLFRASGEPLVTDLGTPLRRAFPRDPMRFIEFVPPEALRTDTVDEHTDLYGLGAIMHLALTGTPPHPGRLGEPPGERVIRVLGEPVPAINRPDVPVPLSTVVARLLTADQAHRPRDAAAIADQLATLLGPPQPAPMPPIPVAAPTPPPKPAEDPDADITTRVPSSAIPQPEPELPDSEDGFDDFADPAAAGRPEPAESSDPDITARVPGSIISQPEPVSEQADPEVCPQSAGPPDADVTARVTGSAIPEPEPQPEPELSDFEDGFDDFAVPAAAGRPEPAESSDADITAGATGSVIPEPQPEPVSEQADPGVPGSVIPQPEPVGEAEFSDAEDDFDDFGGPAPAELPAPVPVAPPSPPRIDPATRIAQAGAPKRPRKVRRELVIGGVVLAGLVAVGIALLVPGSPPELATTPRLPPIASATPAITSTGPAAVVLSEPTDLGNQVVLNWTSPQTLDYAVVIAEEGAANKVLLAYRNQTMTVPVDPLRKYCFLVQGTNGSQVYQSAPKPVRGAVCHL